MKGKILVFLVTYQILLINAPCQAPCGMGESAIKKDVIFILWVTVTIISLNSDLLCASKYKNNSSFVIIIIPMQPVRKPRLREVK